MITRTNSGISFCYISLFILVSCSKSDHTTDSSSAPILNTFTYTIIDTTGNNHTYSDTAKLNPDGTYNYIINGKVTVVAPVAFIWQPYPDNNNRLQFFFNDSSSNNSLFFSLPYFQASLSGTTNNFLISPILLVWKGVYYNAIQPPGGNAGGVYLASFMYSTNISDSTGGYVTGSFNILATTIDSGKIQVIGKFSNMTTTYRP
jgi:hypothetical protein